MADAPPDLLQGTPPPDLLTDKKPVKAPLATKPQAQAQPVAPDLLHDKPTTAEKGVQQMIGVPGKLFGQHPGKIPGVSAIPNDNSHSIMDEFFSLPDYLTVDVLNAAEMGKLKDWSNLSFAQATDKYGFDSKDFLTWVVHSGRYGKKDWAYQHAQYILAHPKAGAAEAFLWEFVNPGQIVMGGGIGKVGEAFYDYLRLSEKGRLFLNIFSPFRGVAKASEKAKWALMAMVNSTRHADESAWWDVYNIFNGLNRDEQIDVVRRMQHGKTIPPGYDQERLPNAQQHLPGEGAGPEGMHEMQPEVGTLERGGTFVAGEGKIHPKIAQSKHLDDRARKLQQVLRKLTKDKKDNGLISDGQIFDDERYFPMYGAYNDPAYEPDDFIQGLRNLQGGAPYQIPPIRPKHFLDIDEALKSGQIRKEWTPAQQLLKHTSRGRQNLVAETFLRDHPGFEDVIRRPGEGDNDIHPSAYAEKPEAEVRVEHRRANPALSAEPPANRMLRPGAKEPGTALAVPDRNLRNLHDQLAQKNPGQYEDLGWAFKRASAEEKTMFTRDTLPKGWVYAEDALPGVKLVPALKGSIVRAEFGDWLREHGGSMMTGDPVYFIFKNMMGQHAADWLNKYNTSYRAAIIANPAYHLLWNIVWNGSAAMGRSPADLVANTGRALAGIAKSTIPGLEEYALQYGEKALGTRFVEAANEYAQAAREAIMTGSTAEWGRPRSALGTLNSIDLFTQPWGALKFSQKMDKLLSSAQEWNRRAVFGPNGEQAFAVRLYGRLRDNLVKKGWNLPDARGRAAELTREALGNYQNVDPNDPWSQLFFFYPWLKSNTTFWMKQFLTNPSYTAGPLLGIRRNNQLANDPNFDQGRFSTPDFNAYMGKNKEGQDQYLTPALPQRLPSAIISAGWKALPQTVGGQGDLLAPVREGQQIAESHANPAASFGTGLITTSLEQMKADVDPHVGSNYDIMFEKDAPLHEQLTDMMKWGVSHAIPLPFIQFTVEDMIREGVPATQIPGRLKENMLQIIGGGYTHARESQRVGRGLARAHSIMEKNIKKQQANFDKHKITADQLSSRINRFYDVYKHKRDQILQGENP